MEKCRVEWARRGLHESRSHRRGSLVLLALGACGAHDGSSIDGELPAGAQQYTFAMASFEVPADGELYKCQDVPNPFGEDIAIVKTESTMSPGAHHMYAFQIPSTEAAFAPGAGLYAAELSPAPEGGVT